jgi:hypothetical protein
MNSMNKMKDQKGAASLFYIALGVLMTVGVIYAMNHYQGRHHDITIKLPKVEVR